MLAAATTLHCQSQPGDPARYRSLWSKSNVTEDTVSSCDVSLSPPRTELSLVQTDNGKIFNGTTSVLARQQRSIWSGEEEDYKHAQPHTDDGPIRKH